MIKQYLFFLFIILIVFQFRNSNSQQFCPLNGFEAPEPIFFKSCALDGEFACCPSNLAG